MKRLSPRVLAILTTIAAVLGSGAASRTGW